MKRRKKKHATKTPERAGSGVATVTEEPRPAHVDWSEPAEPDPREGYDIERNGVPTEVGPDEHGR